MSSAGTACPEGFVRDAGTAASDSDGSRPAPARGDSDDRVGAGPARADRAPCPRVRSAEGEPEHAPGRQGTGEPASAPALAADRPSARASGQAPDRAPDHGLSYTDRPQAKAHAAHSDDLRDADPHGGGPQADRLHEDEFRAHGSPGDVRADGSPADERGAGAAPGGTGPARGEAAPGTDRSVAPAESADVWDDGLIARRATETTAVEQTHHAPVTDARAAGPHPLTPLAYDGPLRSRLDALRELVGLSRTRLDGCTLAEAGRVLDEAAARRRLSGQHTTVAIAGATGSGKSQLFNALAGVAISETGVRRPTTAAPIACSWSDGAASLIDRLGIPGRLRRRPVQGPDPDPQLRGLVLIDLPDHDSAAVQHREHVDRILGLVDAVIWVVDPEKYADAVLHERYLRPMAGHAEVTFVVLNQVDRLPDEAADQVLDDLRRLLDEDGIALGEYEEPGATVLSVSALTGEGIGELREALGQFVAERGAAARRISADVDAAAERLRSVYAARRRTGLSEEAREEFAARLADAVGATAAGEAAERAWLRNANRACGTPWLRLWRWYNDLREPTTGRLSVRAQPDEETTARQRVEQAVRTVADRASDGLPAPWAQAVRESAVRGSEGLPEALDELATRTGLPPGRPPRPGWWPAAVLAQASMTLLQVFGGIWLVCQIAGVMAPDLWVPVLLMVAGIIGGPIVEWSCRIAARGPARRYGQEAERRLREAAAGCGRARVLEPVAAELLRYREVREQYARVVGAGTS
ncbi:GTPase [Streptomyces tropicalis]|uniref:50S ribosome-binding GTPase n=1 Tax=Streptomyces tropicalis TaxID=3034234 RepID=A0ABT5ZYV8_9ACTN|nr:GTPase [Streptomyces tropicalis]MDF3297579.1 50S ribosome-binding GTPase [Streptomyces tropicalis]